MNASDISAPILTSDELLQIANRQKFRIESVEAEIQESAARIDLLVKQNQAQIDLLMSRLDSLNVLLEHLKSDDIVLRSKLQNFLQPDSVSSEGIQSSESGVEISLAQQIKEMLKPRREGRHGLTINISESTIARIESHMTNTLQTPESFNSVELQILALIYEDAGHATPEMLHTNTGHTHINIQNALKALEKKMILDDKRLVQDEETGTLSITEIDTHNKIPQVSVEVLAHVDELIRNIRAENSYSMAMRSDLYPHECISVFLRLTLASIIEQRIKYPDYSCVFLSELFRERKRFTAFWNVKPHGAYLKGIMRNIVVSLPVKGRWAVSDIQEDARSMETIRFVQTWEEVAREEQQTPEV